MLDIKTQKRQNYQRYVRTCPLPNIFRSFMSRAKNVLVALLN